MHLLQHLLLWDLLLQHWLLMAFKDVLNPVLRLQLCIMRNLRLQLYTLGNILLQWLRHLVLQLTRHMPMLILMRHTLHLLHKLLLLTARRLRLWMQHSVEVENLGLHVPRLLKLIVVAQRLGLSRRWHLSP